MLWHYRGKNFCLKYLLIFCFGMFSIGLYFFDQIFILSNQTSRNVFQNHMHNVFKQFWKCFSKSHAHAQIFAHLKMQNHFAMILHFQNHMHTDRNWIFCPSYMAIYFRKVLLLVQSEQGNSSKQLIWPITTTRILNILRTSHRQATE